MSTASFPAPRPPPPTQFGAPVFPQTTSNSQVLMSSSVSTSSSSAGSPPTSGPGSAPPPPTTSAPSTPCCDTGRPILTDPHTGQIVCSCQFSPPGGGGERGGLPPPPGAPGGPPPGLLAGYPRIPGLPEGFYNSQYAAAAAAAAAAASQGFMNLSDPSAFYPAMGAYDLKSLAASSPMYAYDPSMGAYSYANGFLDPNARRKNATRESTQTLKAWLAEHKKNPYPTKGEKIMLAIITKMTLTQVSTWFANARRRLKKENKMTWEPRNRADDEDDDDDEKFGDSDTEGRGPADIGRGGGPVDDDDEDMEEIDIGTESDPEDAARQHMSASRQLMENLATSHALHSLAVAASAANAANAGAPHSVIPTSGPSPYLPRTSSPSSSPSHSPAPSTSPRPMSPNRDSCSPINMNKSVNNSHSGKSQNFTNNTHPSPNTHTPSQPQSQQPTKPKIWSMVDMATSSSSTRSTSPSRASPQRPRTPPRLPPLHGVPPTHHAHAPRPPMHPGFPYSWPGLPYGLPPHLMPQVSTAALLSRYGLHAAAGAMGAPGMPGLAVTTGAPMIMTSAAAAAATSAFCRPPHMALHAPGGERRELHASGMMKSSSPSESSPNPPAPLHTAFRPVPKSKPPQPIHV